MALTVEAREWKYLNASNDICPGCGRNIYKSDRDIEFSKTKYGVCVFWHTDCTEKVWH